MRILQIKSVEKANFHTDIFHMVKNSWFGNIEWGGRRLLLFEWDLAKICSPHSKPCRGKQAEKQSCTSH